MRDGIRMIGGIAWGFDPLDKFPKATDDNLVELLGFIPEFIMNCDNVVRTALAKYGYPASPMTGGVVNEDGVYLYPEDPPLYPIAKMPCWKSGNLCLSIWHNLIYQYSKR